MFEYLGYIRYKLVDLQVDRVNKKQTTQLTWLIRNDAKRTKRSFVQVADKAGPDQPAHKADQDLRCPLTESMDTVVYFDEQTA